MATAVNLEFNAEELADALWLASFVVSLSGAEIKPKSQDLSPLSEKEPQIPKTPEESQTSDETTDSTQKYTSKTRIYSSSDATLKDGLPAGPLRVPARRFLSNGQALMRSLRPLQRKTLVHYRDTLDIEATVQRSAELGWLQCVYTPAREIWLELVLIIDNSRSMRVWRETLQEWQQLLQQHSAFATVKTYHFDADNPKPLFKPIKPTLSRARRQVVWLVSDCVGRAWHSGEIFGYLHKWQHLQPIAIVQMLPYRLWRRTALGRGTECRFYPPHTAGSTTDAWQCDYQPKDKKRLNLPIFTLDPDSHAVYAQLLMAKQGVWSVGFVHDSKTQYAVVPPPSPDVDLSNEEIAERLSRFQRLASPAAQDLAGYLAAVPLTLPIMRLVQDLAGNKQLVSPVCLAEVLLSGLVRQKGEFGQGVLAYDFHSKGLRNKLLDRISATEAARALQEISHYVETHIGGCLDFAALLQHPELTTVDKSKVQVTPEAQHFAEIAAEVLWRLGGNYREIAEELRMTTAQTFVQATKAQTGAEAMQQTFAETNRIQTVTEEPTYKEEIFTFDVILVNSKGKEISRETKQNRQKIFDLGKGITLEMAYIPEGKFMMGAKENEQGAYLYEKPQHEVIITKPFWMGKYPVTVGQFKRFVEETGYKTEAETGDGAYVWTGKGWDKKKDASWKNPYFKQTDKCPVVCVSWNDAEKFIAWLNQKNNTFRLPSEAEWEYACRAKTDTPFHFGETITPDLVNYNGNYPYGDALKGKYREKTVEVDYFKHANNFGLYQMHGNVWEWCEDDWEGNYNTPRTQEAYKNGNENESLRGGSWYVDAVSCRAAVRNLNTPSDRYNVIGFRLILFSR